MNEIVILLLAAVAGVGAGTVIAKKFRDNCTP